MANIRTHDLILTNPETEMGPIDSITVMRIPFDHKKYVMISSETCKHAHITADTLRHLHCKSVETLTLLVTGFMGTKGKYNIKVSDYDAHWNLQSLKHLHIEICYFDPLPDSASQYYTITGENILTTCLTNIFLPSLESLFIKGLFFQEDFSFSTSFPKAYRMEKSMVFDHCIFHPCIIPHITAECLVLQHCYLVLGNGVDEYNLLHITFANIDFLIHKCTFSSTLVEIDKQSFPTKMKDFSHSQKYVLQYEQFIQSVQASIRRLLNQRD